MILTHLTHLAHLTNRCRLTHLVSVLSHLVSVLSHLTSLLAHLTSLLSHLTSLLSHLTHLPRLSIRLLDLVPIHRRESLRCHTLLLHRRHSRLNLLSRPLLPWIPGLSHLLEHRHLLLVDPIEARSSIVHLDMRVSVHSRLGSDRTLLELLAHPIHPSASTSCWSLGHPATPFTATSTSSSGIREPSKYRLRRGSVTTGRRDCVMWAGG